MSGLNPTHRSSSKSSQSSNEGPNHQTAPSSAGGSESDDNEDYPNQPFSGYDEAPLDEALEPIAVVGMGKFPLLFI